ncbi:MAG: glycosyltransferase family 4 protein [Candidatus Yonathbacteria bacterium]|nr:glycosyltransferase family 4 protein [Candidatus Yonathbacteria bacterium]
MKKKILFVITKSNFGGAQKYVYDLATNLPNDRFEAVVALGGSGTLIQKLHDAHIRVLPIFSLARDVNPGNDLSALFELWSIFRSEKPDVVHLNSAKAGGVGALAARLARVPKIIFTAHGWAFNEERSLPQRLAIKFISWITVLLSHKTIAVSEAVKNDVKKWPFIQRKIVVIRNGVKEPEFYQRLDARARLKALTNISVPENAFLVGTIAELHKNKGLSYAIEAFEKLAQANPTIYYFILGGGEEKDRLDAIVNTLGLQGRVFLLGFVEDAPRFLRAFDAFLLPSITEALGFVLLEAGLARLPVVASRVGGIPEIIKDGKTGVLVPPRNHDAIAESIKLLKKDGALAKRFAEALCERVHTHFSLNRALADTMALYTKNPSDII